jgi:SAM-dependent methyltransferase
MLRVAPATAVRFATAERASRVRTASGWDAYFERLPCRHAIFDVEAAFYVDALARTVRLTPDVRVLDFGCGVALAAAMVARRVGHVALWEPSLAMRRRARAHVIGLDNVEFVDLTSSDAPVAERFDLVLANSVIQYMRFDDIRAWLPRWSEMLAPGGRIVLSDVPPAIPRRAEALWDLVDTLALQARHGVLARGLRMRLADAVPYLRARRAAPFTRLDVDGLGAAARACDLDVDVLPRNLTCRRARITVVLSLRSVDDYAAPLRPLAVDHRPSAP